MTRDTVNGIVRLIRNAVGNGYLNLSAYLVGATTSSIAQYEVLGLTIPFLLDYRYYRRGCIVKLSALVMKAFTTNSKTSPCSAPFIIYSTL